MNKRLLQKWNNSQKYMYESFGNSLKVILDYNKEDKKVWFIGGKLDDLVPVKANLKLLERVQWVGRSRFSGKGWEIRKGIGRKKNWKNLVFWELDNSPHMLDMFSKGVN